MRFPPRLVLVIVLIALSVPLHAASVILLDEPFDGSSAKFRSQLKKAVSAADFRMVETDGRELASILSREQGPGAILLMPDGRYLPVDAKGSLQEFLKRGNHLIAASGPAFSKVVIEKAGRWLTRESAKADLANLDGQTIIDFTKEDLSRWNRYAEDPAQKTTHKVEPSGDPRVRGALHVSINKFAGWEMFAGPEITASLPSDWSATVFWAKGGPNTPELQIEWHEKDGARWMTVVKLSTGWKQYVLLPEDFKWWGNKPVPGRGDLKDRFKPQNASAMAFGISNGITNQKQGITHDYWIADIRGIRDIYADTDFSQPVLESLSPAYKTYRITPGAIRRVSTGILSPLDEEIVCPIPRGRGLGCSGLRRYRYQPIIQALAHSGSPRGSAAHIFINNSGDYARSVWGFVGFNQAYLEKSASTTVPLVISMLKRIEGGVFLAGGGTEHMAYAAGEAVKTGAYVNNLKAASLPVKLDFTVLKGKQVIKQDTVTAHVPPASKEEPKIIEGPPMTLPAGEYTLKTVLSANGKTADAIIHDFRVVKFSGQDQKDAVTVSGGEFKLGGKVWRPVGVNYWPRYVTGQEAKPFDHGLSWLSPEQYDPEIVEQDLALMAKLGMNVISVQYNRLEEARNLMDVLARAEKHGLKVNVYLPGLHPLDQNFELARSLIEAAHLPETRSVFAYDCGWEVKIGTYNSRKNWDGEWQQWVIERYGSVESAESQWGFTAQRRNERITSPEDEQLTTDGPWKLYVAAYRRFWDDEISKKYAEVRAFIRSLDKYHLIGARSGYGGCGNPNAAHMFPFDLASGAKHLDFISPEATNLEVNDPAGCLKNGITALYAQLVSAGKPVIWAEYGNSIWPECGPEQIEFQRQAYLNTIQAAIDSGSKGLIAWWWPGGYRLGEESDYGIINPDGSPRPSALEIAKVAARFQQAGTPRKPDAFITIDRDRYTNGFAGIYVAHSGEYWQMVSSGKNPALKTEGVGTTSADTPMIAVGGVPYNGHNPPKYLNAEWNHITINGACVTDGGTIEVERGKPIYIEASLVDTAEAKWLAPKGDGTGCVYLLAESGDEKILAPITADTPFLGDAVVPKFELCKGIDTEKTYTFRMTSKGRMNFGDVMRVTVRAR